MAIRRNVYYPEFDATFANHFQLGKVTYTIGTIADDFPWEDVGTATIAYQSVPFTPSGNNFAYATFATRAVPAAGSIKLQGTINVPEGLRFIYIYDPEFLAGPNIVPPSAIWVGTSDYMISDELSLSLQRLLWDNLDAINAAWQQFGTKYSTVSTADIYVGDRERMGSSGTRRVSICITDGEERVSRADGYMPYGFREYAVRNIMIYVRDDDEELRERLCRTIAGAVTWILNARANETVRLTYKSEIYGTAGTSAISFTAAIVDRVEYMQLFKYGYMVSAARLNWTAWRVSEFL